MMNESRSVNGNGFLNEAVLHMVVPPASGEGFDILVYDETGSVCPAG